MYASLHRFLLGICIFTVQNMPKGQVTPFETYPHSVAGDHNLVTALQQLDILLDLRQLRLVHLLA